MAMKYIHSHVHTEIVDNSFYTTTVEGGTVGFFPIFSEKGKENEIVNINTGVNGFVNTYGADASKFGQAHLNVIQWLQGGGTAAVMRLLPEDASYASAAIIVNVDSYNLDYRINLEVNIPEVLENKFVRYAVKEDFAIEDSTIKELVVAPQNESGNYNFDKEKTRLFANGRGHVAEDAYDLSEDWMRNNGKSVSDEDGEVEEDTGLLAVKSYVNYNLIRDFGDYFKKGTEFLAPEVLEGILKQTGIETFMPSKDNEDDILLDTIEANSKKKTPKTKFFGNKDGKLALAVKYNGNRISFGSKTSDIIITATEETDLFVPDGTDDNGDPIFNSEAKSTWVYHIEGIEFKDDGTDAVYTTMYKKLTGIDINENGITGDDDQGYGDGVVYEEVRVITRENPLVSLIEIATAESSKKKTELKNKYLVEPEKYNFYFSFEDTVVHASGDLNSDTPDIDGDKYQSDKYLSEYIKVSTEDVQFKAAYFLDGYPIETYSETVIINGNPSRVWNARITVTDSEGVTTSYPLFRSFVTKRGDSAKEWEPKFSQEDYVLRALSGLVKYAGNWSEKIFSHTQKVRGFKFDGIFYNSSGVDAVDEDHKWAVNENSKKWKYDPVKRKIVEVKDESGKSYIAAVTEEISHAYADYGYCEDGYKSVNPVIWFDKNSRNLVCLKDLNFDVLKAVNYSGNKDFTRMDADQVTVELYSPSEKKSTSRDGIIEDIKSYVNVYNNNVSNLLEGRKKYPIGYFASQCKGDYYNNMKIYLELNNDLKDTYDFRLYNLTIYDMGGVQTKNIAGPFTVALDKDAIDNAGTSLYIKNIMNTYAEDCEVKFYDDVDANAFKKCAEDLASLFKLKHPLFTFDNAAVDPLFIPQVDENILSTGNPDYEYHSYFAITDDESIPEDQRTLRIQGSNNISTASTAILSNGFFLSNGSSGTLYDKRGNIIQSVYRNLLIKCFTGSTNPDVLDTINNEFDVVLDAKYPNTVKKAMAQFGEQLENSEGGVMVFLDTDNMDGQATGPKNSVDAAVKARRAFSIDSRSVAIFSQNTTAYDEYSSKEIPVSATYLLAYKIPHNDETNGIHTAFVGPRRGSVTLTGPVNWFPTEAEKEKLYKAQINYISRDPKRTAFDCQLTSQIATSALSNIPNVRVLYRIKRVVRKICDEYRFERNTGAIRNQMQGEINEYLRTWVKNGACSTCTATVSANDYQIKQKMAQVDISIVFVGFLERINVTLTVNG